MNIVLLPPLFIPPARYFSLMAKADIAVIDTTMRYDKRRKAVHRTVVSGKEGAPSWLTVPVSTSNTTGRSWDDIRVSGHGEWWRVMRLTLATLFGPTPFFHLYKDEIFATICPEAVGRSICDFDIDLILTMRRFLGITTPLSVTLDERYATDSDVTVTDFRAHDFYADPDSRSVVETLFKDGNKWMR